MRIIWRRWLFLVLGGALFTPYAVFGWVVVPLAVPSLASMPDAVFVCVAMASVLVAIVLSSLAPVVRTVEGGLAVLLLDGPAADLVVTRAQTWTERRRTTVWYLLHTVVGALVSLLSVATPVAVVPLLSSWSQGRAVIPVGASEVSVAQAWAPLVALSLVAVLVCAVWGAGAAAARSAPSLLGPGPAARFAALERRAAELHERNRLATELHDSLGHALTVITLQVGAARTVLHTDPAFVEEALHAVERTGRTAAADLDHVLGMLREDAGTRAPQSTLTELDALLTSHRETGLPVTLVVEGDLSRLPAVVSREVYRVIQEGLTNVQRHAGTVPTSVHLVLADGQLTAEVHNALPPGRVVHHRRGGGHGLEGLRQRVRLLGGQIECGADGHGWRLSVTVPTGGRR